ncbi:MAG: lipopolysaccharide heptosyltransferase family protein [Ignavibacteriae bacterium]|nr:MAG: lipopolysaccharide heptosyltransferase family protein [Ignavibacteriota bacterium]
MEALRQIEKPLRSFTLKLLNLFILQREIKPEEIDHASIKRILIILRHRMGDMVCATPMIRSVRNYYPSAQIILLTKNSTNFSQIYQNDPTIVNEVMKYENGFESLINIIKELKDKKIDLAIIPSTVVCSVTNHLIAYYSQAPIRVGVSCIDSIINEADFLLNVKKEFSWNRKQVHQIERNLDIIRQINISPLVKRIRISPEINEYVNNFVSVNFPDKTRKKVGFHPGAGKEDNVWNPEKYAELAYLLSKEHNLYFFISEGPDDAQFVNKFIKIVKEKYKLDNIVRHKGVLMNNTALISLMDVFITNDTGIMHLASGIEDLPVIALFGPTNAYEWGPLGKNKVSIQSSTKNINDIQLEIVLEETNKFLESGC